MECGKREGGRGEERDVEGERESWRYGRREDERRER